MSRFLDFLAEPIMIVVAVFVVAFLLPVCLIFLLNSQADSNREKYAQEFLLPRATCTEYKNTPIRDVPAGCVGFFIGGE